MTVRKILFVSGSRGEYGYIRPLLRKIKVDKQFSYKLIATNMHLLPTFGSTIKDFIEDELDVHYQPEMTLASFKPASMMKSLCVFGLSITDILAHEKPDFILLAGDRGEQLITAMAGAHLNIPIAHVQAGELSGNIDGVARHAIARYAHLHFAANDDAARRLLQSGEQSFRVFNVGAPQLDEFLAHDRLPANEIYKQFNLVKDEPVLIVMQHAVTEEFDQAFQQMEATMSAIAELKLPTIIIYPNSDAGSYAIQSAIHHWQRPFIQVYRNVTRDQFIGLMTIASAMVGNSSAGILEAPSFNLPAVNIGRRQKGRVQGENVINCSHHKDAILASIQRALTSEFKQSLKGSNNPYGDGQSSDRILQILKNIPIDEKLLYKELTI